MLPAGVEEIEEGDPVEVARENARRKVSFVLQSSQAPPSGRRYAAILGVDTVVTLDGALHGKPRDESHAREMLDTLSGRTHTVISGLALRRGARTDVVHACTEVTFRDLGQLLDWYLPTGEWRDRAGGYAIQGRGAAMVSRITGDYLNVVGLPVAALVDLWPEVLHTAR